MVPVQRNVIAADREGASVAVGLQPSDKFGIADR